MPEMIGDATKSPHGDVAAAEQRQRILLENLPAYVVILSPDARVEYINHAGPRCNVRDVIGRSVNDFLPKKCQKAVAKCYPIGGSRWPHE